MQPKYADETFTFIATTWDVAGLWRLVEDGREIGTVGVESAAKSIGTIFGVHLSSRVDGMTGEDYAMSDAVDITVPVLVVEWISDPQKPEDTSIMIVDGWSRIYRAAREGVEELPCYFFTDEEVRAAELIDDPIRRHIEEGYRDRAALAEIVLDFLDDIHGQTERGRKWAKYAHMSLERSAELDNLVNMLQEWGGVE